MTERSVDIIEREIHAERRALEAALTQLQSRVAPDAIVDQAVGYARAHGGAVAHGAAKVMRKQPLACALIGVGAAWLIAGQLSQQPARVASDPRPYPKAPGLRSAEPPMSGFDRRVERAQAQIDAENRKAARQQRVTAAHPPSEQEKDMTHHESHHSETTWKDQATQAAERAKARAQSTAATLRARLEEGTADMSDAARARVVRAREAALDAQSRIEARAAEAGRTARRVSHEQPLLVGALAFAAGAALALALPRTRVEDQSLGEHRDRLMDEADRIFREEAEKLKSVAEAVVAEGQSIAKEALASDKETPQPDTAAKRVTAKAREKAKETGLGRPN